jgi:hypothetical protein
VAEAAAASGSANIGFATAGRRQSKRQWGSDDDDTNHAEGQLPMAETSSFDSWYPPG